MSILKQTAIKPEQFEAMLADPVLFVQAFDREPYDFQAEILRAVAERDSTGKFKRRIAVVSTPRQNGKSTMSAWLACWMLFCFDGQEIISVANDRMQAGIVQRDARRIISRSGVLFGLVDNVAQSRGLTKSEIRLKNGNTWQIKSSDAIFSRGLRPSVICYDELGYAPDAELFETLLAGQAAQENPLAIITSTVGPVQAGVLWDLFQLAEAGDETVRLIYHRENLSPKVTDEFLERQRSILPGPVYAREHENVWSEGGDAFCTLDDWKRATEEPDPRAYTDAGPSYLFCDLGWVHDETAVAVVREAAEGGKYMVLALDTFQGSQSRPVDLGAVQRHIASLQKRLGVGKVVIESPQGVGMSQQLEAAGLYANVLHPTAKSNAERWGAMYTALKNGTIVLPRDEKLRRQLLSLTIRNTATGWRVDDTPQLHNDRAVAIAGALFEAASDDWVWTGE